VRKEGDPPPTPTDTEANEAYDGLGSTLDFYCDIYGRNSIDGEGMPLEATVHYGVEYDNAFWDGERMVFGDGDGQIFNRFTTPIDILGHELTHGVTQHSAARGAGLEYVGQPGALNEHISDVFGSLIKQFAASPPQTAETADWLIGEGLLVPIPGEPNAAVALRNMKAPGTAYVNHPFLGTDPQPDNMDDYVITVDDNRGVHINSGIPNKAFYLAANAIGGYAWETTGLIWYDTLLNPQLQSTSTFAEFARLTLGTARQLYGRGSSEFAAVRTAWSDVKVL
jgi:Zn-dependent metalloprotease